MEALVARFQGRVSHGVRAELVALTEIPYVKGARAKLLYKAGLRTPEAVAAADVNRWGGVPLGSLRTGTAVVWFAGGALL
jgi:DNA polymerase theta